jgi:hypothetical protein
MKKRIISYFFLTFLIQISYAQEYPVVSGDGNSEMPQEQKMFVLYEQMDNYGSNSWVSQNFESFYDIFDCRAADDFIILPEYIWTLDSIDVLGYYNPNAGPAFSYNVFFYSNSNGLPDTLVTQGLSLPFNDPLITGDATIYFNPPINLAEGHYWISVQANLDFSIAGEWYWTEQLPINYESAWQNPGGGFGTACLGWGYRVVDCGIGSIPYTDLSFRIYGTQEVTPVEVTSFVVKVHANEVELSWITATEKNNNGFEVQRSNGGEFETIAFVEGHGTTTETQAYSYSDKNVIVGLYSYRLKQIDFDGTFTYSNVVAVDIPVLQEFALDQNYPNPFNPSTQIAFRLAVDSKVSLKVFDVLGQEVANLVNTNLVTGAHNVDFNVSSLNSGVYLYRLEATGIDGTNFVDVKKMILTK